MPCGNRPLVKNWDKPRKLRVVKPSRYQKNEASVKQHWKKVATDLELFYKDEKFWESNAERVRHLVGPRIFERLAKIFFLPLATTQYVPQSETSIVHPSEDFYNPDAHAVGVPKHVSSYSLSYMNVGEEEQDEEEEEGSEWSVSSSSQIPPEQGASTAGKPSTTAAGQSRQFTSVLSFPEGRSVSKMFSRSFSKFMKEAKGSSHSRFASVRTIIGSEEFAFTEDDIIVHPLSRTKKKSSKFTKRPNLPLKLVNPHFEMLYCNESETDMIKWNSKYKQKKFEISASDEYSKKAEIVTKQIAYEFFEWWDGLGALEFKSEIKRPKDIEDLFQIWFDEQASRGLVLDPKILPCVLESIADYCGAPETSCPAMLRRMIAADIHSETRPPHTVAFNTSLPIKMKHQSPQNNTKELWHAVRIPEDLRTMECVWGDIAHLTSTKAFQKWLSQRPHLAMPKFFEDQEKPSDNKKELFVVPSDFVVRPKGYESFSSQELALPVSQFSLEVKEVLSKLMND